MAGLKPFDGELDAAPTLQPFTGTLDGEKSGPIRRLADVGLGLAKGAVAVPEAAVGIADIASGGRAGQIAERFGFRPKDAKAILSDVQSAELRSARQQFADADGVLDKAKVAITNPSLIVDTVAESVPSMLGGAAVARQALQAAPRIGAVGAGALGEGVVGAGSAAEQIRQETADGTLTPGQSALAAGSGAATGLLGLAGGKVAQKLGIGDVDTMLAQGSRQVAAAAPPKGIVRRAAEGAVSEGVLEELPQSVSEQVIQNVALDRPLSEGVADQAVLGTLAGGVMGGAAAAASRPSAPTPQPRAEDVDPTVGTSVSEGMAGTSPSQPAAPALKPSEAMGIDPAAGPLSRAAADAVDSGAAQEIQAAAAAQQAAEMVSKKGGKPEETNDAQQEQPAAATPPGDQLQPADTLAGVAPAPGGVAPAPDAADAAGLPVAPAGDPASSAPLDATPAAGIGADAGAVAAPPAPRGSFTSAEQADAYIRQQRRAGGTRMDALPLPYEDGSFGVALRGTDEYPVAEFHAKQRALRARGVADGDILAKSGEPFKNRLAAGHALRQAGEGHQVVPVKDGFVVRKGVPDAQATTATAATLAPVVSRAAPGDAAPAVQPAGGGAAVQADPAAGAGQGLKQREIAQPPGDRGVGSSDRRRNLPERVASSKVQRDGQRSIPIADGREPRAPEFDPAHSKGANEALVTDAKLTGNGGATVSPLGEGFRALDVPSQRRVLQAVSALVEDRQVLRRIVEAVPIKVMDEFVASQGPSKGALGNRAMLIRSLAADADFDVRSRAIDALMRSPAFPVAELSSSSDATGRLGNSRSAMGAQIGDGHAAGDKSGAKKSQPQEQPRAEKSPQAAAEAQPRQARGAKARADVPDAGQPAAAAPVEGVPEGGAGEEVAPAAQERSGLKKMRAARAARVGGVPVPANGAGAPSSFAASADDAGQRSTMESSGRSVVRAQREQAAAAGGRTARGSANTANPFKAFLGKHGISSDLANEFAPGLQERRRLGMVPGYGPIFRKKGKPLDLLAQAAVEEGFLLEADEAAVHDLIMRVMRGERVIAQYAEGVAEDEMQARIDRQREMEEDAVASVAELPDNVLFDLDDAVALDAPSNSSTEDTMRALGFTEQEISDATAKGSGNAQEGRAGSRGPGQGAAGASQANLARGDEEAGPEAQGLTRPTRADIEAQQDRAERAQRNQAAADKQADQRARADAQRADFTLTGSDRAADQAEARGQKPMFRRAEDGRTDARAESDRKMVEIEQMVDQVTAGWARKPEVIIARHVLDKRLPPEILDAMGGAFSQPTAGLPEGVYFRGKVYLIAQTIDNVERARTVLYHEALGHYGLRSVFGQSLKPILQQVATMRRAEVEAKIKSYGFDPSSEIDRLLAAEEVLAEMAQARPEIGFVQRAVAAIRAWLRAHGFTSLKLTDNDIIANYLLPARGFVERGRAAEKAPSTTSRAEPAFSRQDRYQAGAALSKEQRSEVLRTLTDVYKAKGAPREFKGLDANGNEKSGYVHSPDLFERSDITGAMVRYFVKLPDGRIAHPSELFPDYTQSDIDRALAEQREEVRKRTALDESRLRTLRSRVAPSLGDANRIFNSQNPGARAYVPAILTNGKEFARTSPEAAERDARLLGDGWRVQSPDAPMFSRGTSGDVLKAITATELRQRAGHAATDYRGIGLQALGRRQLVELYAKDLPQLTEYSKLVQQMDADKNEAGAGADAIAERWGKLPDEAALANLMHDATLAQMDPALDLVKGDDPLTHARLRKAYDALSPEARKIYAEARDTYRAHHENVRQAIRDRIERSDLRGPRKAELLKQMDDEFFKAIKGVYFPLARFGDYVVVVRGDDGQAISVSRAETMHEAQALRAELVKAYPKNEVGKVLKAKEFNAGRDMVGRGFMQELYGALAKKDMSEQQRGELEDMLGQLYLSALPDLSWAKHGIHRKGTAGFSQDARRAFAQNTFHGARYLAKIRYSDLLEAELTAMQKHVDSLARTPGYDSVRAQQVVDEMNKRHDAYMNPQANPLSTALTSLGFIFHLGLSPASAMVNLTQTALVAYPIMGARWGFAKASAALLKASQQAAANRNDISTTLSPEERRAFDEAVRSGVIDVTMAHDLAGISQGEDAKVSWKLRPVMKWASFLFHHAEKFNRQVTFVAAYRLAREAGTAPATAYDQAVKATYDGHFDYSAGNRPRLMQGNVAKVVLLFKQYAQNMVYTLSRQAFLAMRGATPAERAEARKALGGLLALHGAAAGVLGLPLVTTLLGIASMLGGSDDEPWDAEVALRNMLADAFGAGPADVLARGLSRATPWDISGRVALDKLIFPDIQEGLEGARWAESIWTALGGPVLGIGVNVAKGMQSAADGQWARGLEEMAPSVLRGPIKALRYGTEGAIDRTGKPIVEDVGALGVAGQALGFSPSEVRLATEAKSAIHQADDKLKKRRAALMRHYAMAVINEDGEGAADAKEAIQAFNEKNPDRRINAMQMAQSVRQRRKQIAESEQGVYLPKNRRGAMEAGRFGVAE